MITRRQFNQCFLVAGIGLSFGLSAQMRRGPLSPQWWLEVDADGAIRMLTSKVEIGQGAHTGLRTLLAEELDVDPATVEIRQVPSMAKYGEIITGGSFTLAGWHDRMRRAGATARHMLLTVAAHEWRVPIASLQTSAGRVLHPTSQRTAPYSQFVTAAASLELPAAEEVKLKSSHQWRYIGKPGPIAYQRDIVSGVTRYGIDERLPGLCFAVLARAPTLGAQLRTFDDTNARRVSGFIKAVPLAGNQWPTLDYCRDAVAVLATNSWAAQRAREALQVDWQLPAGTRANSEDMFAALAHAASEGPILSFERTDPEPGAVAHELTREYRHPYVAHAPMEPPNATARMIDDRIEVWCGTQRQTRMQVAIAQACGVPVERVIVHANISGGSFGRRLEVDYGIEAAKLAVAVQRPVQVLWTRDDDLTLGLYRPASVHRVRAALDRDGKLVEFNHCVAAESVLRQQEPDQIGTDGADWTIAAPLVALLYAVPRARLEHRPAAPMAPCAWWRGTHWNNVTAVVECAIDELAQMSGQDPLAFRLAHLGHNKREFVINPSTRISFDPTRMRNVLNAVAQASGWGRAAPRGHVRGLACGLYDSPECHSAVVVEATLRNGVPTLTKTTVAVDVGTAVNPEIVKAQAMGGFVMGASAALKEQITWRDGQVQQRSFADYAPMRMNECPDIDVVIVPSEAGICGVGEIVTPAAIGAVTNALSRLLDRRVTQWPISTVANRL